VIRQGNNIGGRCGETILWVFFARLFRRTLSGWERMSWGYCVPVFVSGLERVVPAPRQRWWVRIFQSLRPTLRQCPIYWQAD